MQKERSLLRISLAILTLTVVSAGRTQTTPSADYFPLTEGSTWKLTHKANGNAFDTIGVITKSLNEGAVTKATMTWSRLDTVVTSETYQATATEVDRTSGGADGTDRVNPPLPIIKYPLTAGAKWTWKGTITLHGEDVEAESVSTVSGPISLNTGAGMFKAMKVHSDLKITVGKGKYSMPSDYYYAPGVGIVEVEAKLGAFQTVGKLTSYKVK